MLDDNEKVSVTYTVREWKHISNCMVQAGAQLTGDIRAIRISANDLVNDYNEIGPERLNSMQQDIFTACGAEPDEINEIEIEAAPLPPHVH